MSSIPETQHTANVRVTFGDINIERRTPPLGTTADPHLLTLALNALDRLEQHCRTHGLAGQALNDARVVLALHDEAGARFYGGDE